MKLFVVQKKYFKAQDQRDFMEIDKICIEINFTAVKTQREQNSNFLNGI